MAKVALCISGAFRGENFIEYLNDTIGKFKSLNPDVFIASWDSYKIWPGVGGLGVGWIRNWYSQDIIEFAPKKFIGSNSNFKKLLPEVYKILEKEIDKHIDNNLLEKIKRLDNVKSIKLSNEQEYLKQYPSNLEIANSAKMFYGFWQVVNLLLEYETKNNFYYDYIIVLRPDKIYSIDFDLKFIETLQQDNEIICEEYDWGMMDISLYGKRYAMIELLSLFDKASRYKHLDYFKYFPSGICCAPIGFLDHYILVMCVKFIGLKINNTNFIKYNKIDYNPRIPNIQKALLKDLENIDTNRGQDYILFFDILNCPKLLSTRLAKQIIKNYLSYKLGEAMIANSKSLLGYIKMPFKLNHIKKEHNNEQKAYEKIIKKHPNLKLPPLETYPDYNEAIKIKEHLSYKLGEALIKANNKGFITGGGGVFGCYLRLGA